MPMTALVSGMFVSMTVRAMYGLMLAISVAMVIVSVLGGRCASEMSVDATIAIVAMVDGDSVARYVRRVQEQRLARSRRGEPWRPV